VRELAALSDMLTPSTEHQSPAMGRTPGTVNSQ